MIAAVVYGLAPRHGPCFELHAGLVVAASVLVSELPLRVVESSLVRVGVGRIRRAGRGMQQGKPAGGPAGRQGRKGRYIRLVESHHQPCPASRPGASLSPSRETWTKGAGRRRRSVSLATATGWPLGPADWVMGGHWARPRDWPRDTTRAGTRSMVTVPRDPTSVSTRSSSP